MSNAEKISRRPQTSQLKKDLTNAAKVLESVTNQVAKIEACMVDSEEILAAERNREEQVLALRKQVDQLSERLQKCEEQRVREADSFTTSTERLTETFHTRLQRNLNENQSEVENLRQHAVVQEQQWKQAMDSEKTQIQRLREKGEADCLVFSSKLKKATELWQVKEDAFNSKVGKLESVVADLSQRNDVLMKDLDENRIILRGQETKVARLTSTLQSLEAFSSKSSEQ
jgi:hypothetical protein